MDQADRKIMDERIIRNELMYRRRQFGYLDKKDVTKIREYLENPTKTGIWTLKASKADTLKKYLEKEIKKIRQKKDIIEVPLGKKTLKINLKKKGEESFLRNFDKFTFVFTIFNYLYHLEQEDDSFDTYLEMEDSEYKILLNIIDLEKLKNEFNDAFDYFKEHIYFKNFDTTVKSGKITKIKEGFFLFPKETGISSVEQYYAREYFEEEYDSKVELISLTKDSLEKVKVFFEKAGFINQASLIPTYSPEEEVFSPYFSLLEQVYYKIIDNSSTQRLFKKSISEYNDENYSHCISTVGLITEEYLVQIYETLFRDICPKRPLGELYDQIHIKIKKELGTKTEKNIDFSKYFNEIKKIEKVDKYPSKNIISILRSLINLTKDMHSITESKIRDIQKPKSDISIFNKQLRDNISEVIKNRNATSHRSRIPLGNYEALRSVYGCITLILWWTRRKETIDWTEEPNEILKKIVEENK